MTSTRTPGPDLEQAATHGGANWRARTASHADEIADGVLWRPYRVASEVAPLRAVLLAFPGVEMDFDGDPDAQLMLGKPDLGTLQTQVEELAALYNAEGIEVHLHRPRFPPPPNWIFLRDLLLMTPEGAILGRPAARQRAGEERTVAEALAACGVPILRSLRGTATFEGADALWLDPRTVVVGVGLRTNSEGFTQLARALGELGVTALRVPMPDGVQHLLGVVDFLDHDLAAVRSERVLPALRDLLDERGVRTVELPDDDELLHGRGMNFVTLAPRRVLMPAGCPGIRARLRAEGVEVVEADVSEYLRAAGGPGCLTGILWRE